MTHENANAAVGHCPPRQLPKSDWQIFDEVLSEKGIPRQVMIYPERYMDQYNVTRRKVAIKLMYERGMSKDSLTAQTPYSRRHIDRILNGHLGHEAPIMQGVIENRETDGA